MKIRQLIAGGIISISVMLGAIPVHADPNVYTVAYIYPEELIVRAAPSTDAREIDRVYRGQEVEVVEKCGDWAKVCITLDSYGYINAYHFAYRTYYADGSYSSTEQVADSDQEYYDDYDYNDYSYDDYDYSYDDYDYDSYDYSQEYSYDDSYYEPQTSYYEEPASTYAASNDYQSDSTTSYEEEQTSSTASSEDDTSYVSSSGGQSISDSAKQYIGNPYVYGGESLETGADCSGFTKAVLESNGYSVNGRTAADQAAGGTQISLSEAQAGDLIYYDNGNGVYHIAIYNGDGTVTHSSNSTTGVTVSDMNYSGNAAGAVRYWD